VSALVSGYGLIGLTFVQGIVLVPLYLQHVEANLYGAWLACSGVISILATCDLGILGILTQRISNFQGAGDQSRSACAVGTGFCLSILVSALPLVLGISASVFLPSLMNLKGEAARNISLALLIGTIGTTVSFASYAVTGVLAGFQKHAKTGLSWAVAGLVAIAFVVFFIEELGVQAIALGNALRPCLFLVFIGPHALKVSLSKLNGEKPRWNRGEAKYYLRTGRLLFAANLAQSTSLNADNLLVAVAAGPSSAAAYGLTKKCVDILVMLVQRIPASLLPALSHLIGERGLEAARNIRTIVFRVGVGISVFASFGLVFFNGRLVALWAGEAYFAGVAVNSALACALFLSIANRFAYYELVAIARFSDASRASLIEGIVRIIIAPVAMFSGGTFALALSGGVAALPRLVHQLRALKATKSTCRSPGQEFWRSGLRHLPGALTAGTTSFLIGGPSWTALLLALGSYCSVVLLWFSFSEPAVRALLGRASTRVAWRRPSK